MANLNAADRPFASRSQLGLAFHNFYNYTTLAGFGAAALLNLNPWIAGLGLLVEGLYLLLATATPAGRTLVAALLAGERRKASIKAQVAVLGRLTKRSRERFIELNQLKFHILEGFSALRPHDGADREQATAQMEGLLRRFLDLADRLYEYKSALGRVQDGSPPPNAPGEAAVRGGESLNLEVLRRQTSEVQEQISTIEEAFRQLAREAGQPDAAAHLLSTLTALEERFGSP